MTTLGNWLTHRMNVLEIAGPADLAEHADLAEATLAEMVQTNCLSALQKSQRRRLAWALQVNLKRLDALADGEIEWIDDADRYLPFSFEPGRSAPMTGLTHDCRADCVVDGVAAMDRVDSPVAGFAIGSPADRQAAGDNSVQLRCSGAVMNAPKEHAGSIRAEFLPVSVGSQQPPQGTPVLGRVGEDGRIESDGCWDEQWGRRLADGQPQRRDTYALETPRLGEFVVVRNANPWEATAGAWVSVYLCDDGDGIGYFGHLIRCIPGAWALRPGLPGRVDETRVITVESERALRIGRLMREWPAG